MSAPGLRPGDVGYVPDYDSVLRRVRSEAVRFARVEQSAALQRAIYAARRAHGRTADGRLRYGLERAAALLGMDVLTADLTGPTTELLASVVSEVDSVEVGVYLATEDNDGRQEADPWPVRIGTFDGAGTDTTAWAYLTADEADRVAAALTDAAVKARAHAEQIVGAE